MKQALIRSSFPDQTAKNFRHICLLLMLAVGSSSALWAQAVGSIIGTVADPSGALVTGATVTATNVDNQISKKVVTGSSGQFTISNLAVGKYNVTAEATGFTTSRADNLTLDVSQTRNIDFKLVPGGRATPPW